MVKGSGDIYTLRRNSGGETQFLIYFKTDVMNKQISCVPTIAVSIISSNSGESSPENSNYLRVSAAFGQRRLSDNVLTAPGHRRFSGALGSTSSTPGSVPGTPCVIGFPIRRHSSAAFAANRRYSSNALLSPSTSSKVHFFLTYLHSKPKQDITTTMHTYLGNCLTLPLLALQNFAHFRESW